MRPQANIEDNKIATGKQRTLSNPVKKSLRPIFVQFEKPTNKKETT